MLVLVQGLFKNSYYTRRMMMSEENSCKHPENHAGHLCMLVSKGLFEEVKKLTRHPKFICFTCGRVADSSENLCNPMPND